MSTTTWPTTTEVYAAAGRSVPRWVVEGQLAFHLCDRVCPNHKRHCGGDAEHSEPCACALCPDEVQP